VLLSIFGKDDSDLNGVSPELTAVEDSAEKLCELVAWEGFCQEAMTATLLRPFEEVVCLPFAQADDGNVAKMGVVADCRRHFKRVRLRQIQIKQDKIRAGLHTTKLLQDMSTCGIALKVDTLLSKKIRDCYEAVSIIFDYECPQIIKHHAT
jgi:hypothetical protein